MRRTRPFLAVPDIAVELGISRTHVYRLIRRGAIPHVRVAGVIQIRGSWAVAAGQDREALAALRDAHRSVAS
jgi:excisionase family DNA binding protein